VGPTQAFTVHRIVDQQHDHSPLIGYPDEHPETGIETNEIVDGQQRVTTIRDYIQGKFALSPEDEVEYAENVGAIIQGKRFIELPSAIQKQIQRYSLNFIRLGAPEFFPVDPLARHFPTQWRNVWFRRNAIISEDGTVRYQCPLCRRWFDHTYIDDMQGDHVWPYSLFGETVWENYQLICGNCNAGKGNFVETELRRALGRGDFRCMVASHLARLLDAETLPESLYIRQMVGS